MTMIEGPGDIYTFMLSDGANKHYYQIYAIDETSALKLGAKWFTDSYKTVHTEVKFNRTGLPLSKNF